MKVAVDRFQAVLRIRSDQLLWASRIRNIYFFFDPVPEPDPDPFCSTERYDQKFLIRSILFTYILIWSPVVYVFAFCSFEVLKNFFLLTIAKRLVGSGSGFVNFGYGSKNPDPYKKLSDRHTASRCTLLPAQLLYYIKSQQKRM